jgi:hypothetical protein
MMTMKKRTLSLYAKGEIVVEAYHIQNNVKATARRHNVQPQQVQRWKKAKLDDLFLRHEIQQIGPKRTSHDAVRANEMDVFDLDDQPSDHHVALIRQNDIRSKKRLSKDFRRLPGGGSKPLVSDEDINSLKQFYIEQRETDFPITMPILVCELMSMNPIYNNMEYSVISQRILRLLHKWQLSYRKGTHKAQNTRFRFKVMKDFHSYIRQKINSLKVTHHQIFNFDETNVPFTPSVEHTWHPKGTKNVPILDEKCSLRCTIMLGSSMSGEKATPFIIYTGKNTARGVIKQALQTKNGYSQVLEYGVQENGWMDEKLMLEWIDKVWRPIALHHGTTLLIIDAHRSHMTSNVKDALSECNTELEIIPSGYTSKLQPMDVGVNKQFKDINRKHYIFWLKDNRGSKPKRETVSEWMEKVWDEIPQEQFVKAFKSSGFGYEPANNDNTIFNDNNDDDNFDYLDDLPVAFNGLLL